MKTGRSFRDLIGEIRRQASAKRDLHVPTNHLIATVNGSTTLALPAPENSEDDVPERCPVLPYAEDQLASTFGIPLRYYKTLRKEQPRLLQSHLNGWFGAVPRSHRRLIRTLDGNVRAILSDRYRIRDNVDLMEWLLPFLEREEVHGRPVMEAIQMVSGEITDRRLYLKFVTHLPQLRRTLKTGDEVRGGVIIGNSEVGDGSTHAYPFTEVLWCTNGCTHTKYGERKYHIGRKVEDSDAAREVFRDDTIRAEDEAFFLKFRDIVIASLSEKIFHSICDDMDEAAGYEITGHIEPAFEVVQIKLGLTEEERADALSHFVRGKQMSLWGVSQAVTRTAQDVQDYDRASELERAGGEVLHFDRATIKAVCEARPEKTQVSV